MAIKEKDKELITKIILKAFPVHKNIESAAYFLNTYYSNKKIILHGAGLHTYNLIKELRKINSNILKNILFITDKNGYSKYDFDYPVKSSNYLKQYKDYDFIILSSDINYKHMQEELLSLNISKNKLISIYEHNNYVDIIENIDIKQILDYVNKDTIVFLAVSFPLNYIKLFNELEKYYNIVIISLNNQFSGIKYEKLNLNYKFFHIKQAKTLLKLIETLEPKIFYVLNSMFHLYFGATIVLNSKVPVISDFIDITSSAFDTNSSLNNYCNSHIEFLSEKIIWENSDGIIYKESNNIIEIIKKKYNISEKRIQILPCIPNKNTKKRRKAKIRKIIKIVYAGGIHSKNSNNDATELHQSLYNIAKKLIKQGFDFTIFNAFDNGKTDGWNNFVELSNNEPLFHYNTAVNILELPNLLSEFDIGWYVFDFSKGKAEKNEFYKYGFGTKFSLYVESNLPIIISKEHFFMSNMVNKYNIGLSIDYDYIDKLQNIINIKNISLWRNNLYKIKKILSCDIIINKLVDFINCVEAEKKR